MGNWIQWQERRRSRRIASVDLRARCESEYGTGTYWLTDISTGGACLMGHAIAPVGAPLMLELEAPDGASLRATAMVVRTAKRGIGLVFDSLDEMGRQLIYQLAHEDMVARARWSGWRVE